MREFNVFAFQKCPAKFPQRPKPTSRPTATHPHPQTPRPRKTQKDPERPRPTATHTHQTHGHIHKHPDTNSYSFMSLFICNFSTSQNVFLHFDFVFDGCPRQRRPTNAQRRQGTAAAGRNAQRAEPLQAPQRPQHRHACEAYQPADVAAERLGTPSLTRRGPKGPPLLSQARGKQKQGCSRGVACAATWPRTTSL